MILLLLLFKIILDVGMGCCISRRKGKNIVLSTRAIFRPQKFQETNFYFTTENLTRVQADCLVLFCDQKINLNKNKFLVNEQDIKRLANYTESYLLRSRLKVFPGQILLFPISIKTLKFKYVCIAFLKIWDGQQKIRVNLENTTQSLFSWLEESNISSIAITEFSDEFGIPAQMGCKILLDELQRGKKWIKNVTFICNDIASQSYFMEKIIQTRQWSSNYRQSRTSASNYF